MRTKIIIAVVAVVVLVAVYFLFFHKKAPLAPGTKVGSQKGPSAGISSIAGLAAKGIKALTGSPSSVGSSSSSDDDDDDSSSSDDDDDS